MTLLSIQSNQSKELLIDTVQIDYKTYLTAQEISDIEHETTILEYREAAGIEALKIVQKQRGWISDESLYAIADLLQMSVVQLEGVATFYNLIYRQPVGKYVVHVCNSISCYLTGYEHIAETLKQQLGIGFGQTTSDGVFTLITNACLGGCDKGPTLMVGEQHYQNLTSGSVKALIDDLRQQANPSQESQGEGNE